LEVCNVITACVNHRNINTKKDDPRSWHKERQGSGGKSLLLLLRRTSHAHKTRVPDDITTMDTWNHANDSYDFIENYIFFMLSFRSLSFQKNINIFL